MNNERNLEELEVELHKLLQSFLQSIPGELVEDYADLPLRLKIVLFQEIEKVISSGAEERIHIAAIVFKKESEVKLSDYALGRILGTMPYILDIFEKAALKFPDESVQTHINKLLQLGKETKQQILQQITSTWPPEPQGNFFKGYSESLIKTSSCQEGYPGQSQNFKLYFTLFAHWPAIRELENITSLYEEVKKQKLYFGDEPGFRRMCSRVGISLSPRGRPKTTE